MASNRVQLQRILDVLAAASDIDASHIGAIESDGVVTLIGYVTSDAQKLAAKELVQSVPGVRTLAVELGVRLPGDKRVADDEIAARAQRLLEWDLCVPIGTIGVTVEDGVVSLRGEVDWQFLRREAELDIAKLSGVKGVINEIRVRPQVAAAQRGHAMEITLAQAELFMESDIDPGR